MQKLDLSKHELMQLRDEAEFYLIKPIVQLIDAVAKDKPSNTLVYVSDYVTSGHDFPASVQLVTLQLLNDGFHLNNGWSTRQSSSWTHHVALVGDHYPSPGCVTALKLLRSSGRDLSVKIAFENQMYSV